MIFATAPLLHLLVLCMQSKNVFGSVGLKNHKIVEYGNCSLSKDKYDAENLLGHSWNFYKVHGRTYLRVVLTVYKKTPPVVLTIRGYRLQSLTSERKEDFTFDMSCRNPVLSRMISKLHLNIDTVNCTAQPGTYLIPRLNLEEFSRFYRYTSKQYTFYQFEVYAISKNVNVNIILDLSTN